MHLNDTIAAIATPPGRGGVGIVRVSGRMAMDVLRRLFMPRNGNNEFKSHKMYYGEIVDLKSIVIDAGLCVCMNAPHSYTGEDTVEFHCHGSPAILSRLLEEINQLGVRTAFPGEFSKRAFINGKIDLVEAEAILDLVNAAGSESARLALNQLKGSLSKRIEEIRDELLALLSGIDAGIDFPESVDESQNLEERLGGLLSIKAKIDALVSSYKTGRMIKDGLLIQIIGKPNVGKSSLFNALLGRDRAIVHHEPGTTRDYIEEELALNGITVRLVDSAGLWLTGEGVEAEGIRRANEVARSADAFLMVIDASLELKDEDFSFTEIVSGKNGIAVLNKMDLLPSIKQGNIPSYLKKFKSVCVSAKTGAGIADLRQNLKSLCLGVIPPVEPGMVTRVRHLDCLRRSLNGIENTINDIKDSAPMAIVSDELHRAIKPLGELLGEEIEESLMDRIFSEFCIGK
ncbi:MAG TPA: tRNA uridine-5-carboxymethylaminomethyl(34) synthesis GTPase MnmE [bacterium]